MKLHNNPIMRTVFRVVYVIILLSIIVLLIAIEVFKDNEWLMWLILGAGFILMFVIEDYLCRRFPEIFPTTEKEKEVMQMIDEISKEGEKDESESHVVLPRTLVGTLCELATVGILAYALYRAWTLDQRLIGVIGLSVLALAFLFGAYHPNFLKKQLEDPSDMKASLALADKSRVRAIFGALIALLFTYCYEQGIVYNWRHMYLAFVVLYIVMSLILNYLSRRSSALTAKENHYNPADKRVARTLESSIFEIVTILFLIGAWCAAAINHQLTGKGILDIPIADLIMCSIIAIGGLALAYFPKWMSNAGNFKSDRQVLLDIRRHRIYAVVFALLALIIPFIPNVNDQVLGIIYVVVTFVLSLALSNRKILEAGESNK